MVIPSTLPTDDPLSIAVSATIGAGDLDALRRLLAEHPGLAAVRLGESEGQGMSRTLLHMVTDWPGHLPHGAAMVKLLVEAGADVDGRFAGPHIETPLHWAASSDDVEVLDALLDAGADIDADGAVIAGGAPLMDAAAFGQWHAARRLVERGAAVELFPAAALGLMEPLAVAVEGATPEEVTGAFWGACHGGQRHAAEYLLGQGADLSWVGWDDLTPLDAAIRSDATEVVEWLRAQGARTTVERG